MKITDKLEIGSGNNPTVNEGYTHLDMNPDAEHVEIVGDIRAIIAPQEYDITKYPTLESIQSESFEEIKTYHFIEHIQWIYQESLFRLFYDWLLPGGILNIHTPDLKWIVKSYLHNSQKTWFGKPRFRFPESEHPDLIESGNKTQFYKWVNYRLFSGCSPEDYHHCMYDKQSLRDILSVVGFQCLSMKSKYATLMALSLKPKQTLDKNIEFYKG